MELLLNRRPSSRGVTLGELYTDGGVFVAFSLEPDADDADHPAIPVGRYPVTITPSLRFRRMLPLIEHVPHRQGIRVHPGNDARDTDGCILLGLAQVNDGIEHSREACQRFQSLIALPLAKGEDVWLTVQQQPKPPFWKRYA